MELLLDKTPVFLTETVYDGQTEQGIELDYVLPDYFPDIFKILRCTLTPCVVSYNVSGSQLYIDGVVYIKVLYLPQNSRRVCCVDQRYTYSKTIELSKPVSSPKVSICPKVDYCNCRAVSGRRIDVRGAVSCTVRVTGTFESEILSGASGMGTQVCKTPVKCCESTLCADRQFVVREDIETGAGMGIAAILSQSCTVTPAETKVIADKVIVKGEVNIRALYLLKSDEDDCRTEVMEASVPVSQIIDLPGVTDSHQCFAELTVMDCDLEIKQTDDAQSRMFGCEIAVDCRVSAYTQSQIMTVCDLYSTDYESSFTVTPVKIEHSPQMIQSQLQVRSALECTGGISEILDCRCDTDSITAAVSPDGTLSVMGRLCIMLIGKDPSGAPCVSEKTENFECRPDIADNGGRYSFSPCACVSGTSYSITGDSTAEVRVQINISGILCRSDTVNVVNTITVSEDKPRAKDTDHTLKLCFAGEGESVWDIAKRYNTSPEAIIEENELDQDKLAGAAMLLIPIL